MKRECRCPRARHAHGTAAGYSVCGCGCLPCRFAYAEQTQARRAGLRDDAERSWPFVSGVGVQRRIEALHAIGWSAKELGERLGVSHQQVHRLRLNVRPVMPVTAERVGALYDALWDQPQTETKASTYLRNLADRNGWLPPLAWDDDEIDDPDATPHTPTGPSAWDYQPCGTAAAARRHYRRGEPLCPACAAAARRQKNERKAA